MADGEAAEMSMLNIDKAGTIRTVRHLQNLLPADHVGQRPRNDFLSIVKILGENNE